jgi:Fe-S cluster assembly ATP-binding protein
VLARDVKLALFDEPEAGIDLWSFNNLIRIFENMRRDRRGRSIIVISHQERILNIADEIVVIADGKIVKQGDKDTILPEITGTENAVNVCSKIQ